LLCDVTCSRYTPFLDSVGYLTMLNGRMTGEFERTWQGNGRGLINVPSRYLSGCTEEGQDSQCSCQDSHRESPDYVSRALPLDQPLFSLLEQQIHTVTCIPITRQRRGKYIPTKRTDATEGSQLLVNGPVNTPPVFSVGSVPKDYKGTKKVA
jgi:hypothetical protein